MIQEEIKRGNDDPNRVSSRMLFESAYTTHPYRLPVIGTKESVDSFTRDDVVSFFHKHYVPNNMTLVLVGDFELEAAKAKRNGARWAIALGLGLRQGEALGPAPRSPARATARDEWRPSQPADAVRVVTCLAGTWYGARASSDRNRWARERSRSRRG